MKKRIEQTIGIIFGLIFVALSIFVTIETIVRKLFNFSLQGADELGGYTLAFGATLAFSMALIGRTHIRVDVFHELLPPWLKAALNWLSITGLAAFGGLLAWLAWFTIQDSLSYKSVSQTPWATPLAWPQTAWLIGLMLFGAVAIGYALHATWLLLSGNMQRLDHDYGPRTASEEVADELDDLKTRLDPRGAAPINKTQGTR